MAPRGRGDTIEERALWIREHEAWQLASHGEIAPEDAILLVVRPPEAVKEASFTKARIEEAAEKAGPFTVKACRTCSKAFAAKRGTRSIYCSTSCRNELYRQKSEKLQKTCRRGHLRTPENTRVRGDGHVRCLDCQKAQNARRKGNERRLRSRKAYYERHRETLVEKAAERYRRRRRASTGTSLSPKTSSSTASAASPTPDASSAGERTANATEGE